MSLHTGENAAPLLRLERVSRSYEKTRALSEVSFTLHAGELGALLGENGAGKTTTLQLIAGLRSPDAGLIEGRGGAVAWGTEQMKQMVGYLAEAPFLYETLSGLEMLEFVGALQRLPRPLSRQRAEPFRRGGWSLHIVGSLPDPVVTPTTSKVMGVDLGLTYRAATSTRCFLGESKRYAR